MKTTAALAAAALDTILAALNNGSLLRIYSGSPPTLVTDSATGMLLAELTCLSGTTPFGSTDTTTVVAPGLTGPSAGAGPVKFAQDTSANATGTAGYWRLTNSGGTAKLQGSVGVSGSGAELILSSLSITSGLDVTVATFSAQLTSIF